MKCSELQFELALSVDGASGEPRRAAVESHLSVCPLCRQSDTEYREMLEQLGSIKRPAAPAFLKQRINESLRNELDRGRRPWPPVTSDLREWLQMRVMPYGVGVLASLMIGVTFLTMMFSGMLAPRVSETTARTGESSIMIASNRSPYEDPLSGDVISPIDFAKTRMAYSAESPSINPQGALVALTKSFMRGKMKDEEVVVVADVFSNGLARVAEVVEPSDDVKAVAELEKALQSDPAFAPFVPATLDDRPDSVRVVLKFQSVNVEASTKRNRARL